MVEHIYEGLTPAQIETLNKLAVKYKCAPRKCMAPGCQAIVRKPHNHLLQKNGIISNIQQDNHVMSLEDHAYDKDIKFSIRGIDNCFKANLLCPTCDDEMFKNIEKRFLDFEHPQTPYLFSLRALLWEIRKNEFLKEQNNAFHLIGFLSRDDIDEKNYTINSRLNFLGHIEKKFRVPPYKINELFICKYRIIKKVDVALTSAAGMAIPQKESFEDWEKKETRLKVFPLFYHVLPMQNWSVFLIYFSRDDAKFFENSDAHKSFYPAQIYKNFDKFSEQKLLQALSNLMVYFCEDWVTSIDFYKKYIKPNEGVFIREKKRGLFERMAFHDFTLGDTFNFFKVI